MWFLYLCIGVPLFWAWQCGYEKTVKIIMGFIYFNVVLFLGAMLALFMFHTTEPQAPQIWDAWHSTVAPRFATTWLFEDYLSMPNIMSTVPLMFACILIDFYTLIFHFMKYVSNLQGQVTMAITIYISIYVTRGFYYEFIK